MKNNYVFMIIKIKYVSFKAVYSYMMIKYVTTTSFDDAGC